MSSTTYVSKIPYNFLPAILTPTKTTDFNRKWESKSQKRRERIMCTAHINEKSSFLPSSFRNYSQSRDAN